jgi:hypothetical protein
LREPRFLHVGINYSAQVDIGSVDKAIESEAWDWFRYSLFCYVVWTTSDAETVTRKILRVPGLENSTVLVWGLDLTDGFGSLPSEMWDWLKRDRGYGGLQIWHPQDFEWPALPPPAAK